MMIVTTELKCHFIVVEDVTEGLSLTTQPAAVIQASPQCEVGVVWQCICGRI